MPNNKQTITILGSTGSIGMATLDVVQRHSDKIEVFALSAYSQFDRLFEQCKQFNPRYAFIFDPDGAEKLSGLVKQAGLSTKILRKLNELESIVSDSDVDIVMAAIVGAAGLMPTLAAAKAGKRVLLANKETLVMAGQLFMDAAVSGGAEILPIDSEHNAIFQCLPKECRDANHKKSICRILLTGSGGPFRSVPYSSFKDITPEQACNHPNWKMGKKISVDSATMMNKGLEIIEACWLFDVPDRQIEIVIHPQSVIHSMVEYTDGSVLAQLGNPDMRTPIAHALTYPNRISSGVAPLDLFKIATLTFEKPDLVKFPCLKLARQALTAGGTTPVILNAANEIAVAKFLENTISFVQIPELIQSMLDLIPAQSANSIDDILEADTKTRHAALEWVKSVCVV
jgi:1-deoxy-D-xylulose-5-phosphate reductoisomerase